MALSSWKYSNEQRTFLGKMKNCLGWGAAGALVLAEPGQSLLPLATSAQPRYPQSGPLLAVCVMPALRLPTAEGW